MKNLETVSFLYGLCAGLSVGVIGLLVVMWVLVRVGRTRP